MNLLKWLATVALLLLVLAFTPLAGAQLIPGVPIGAGQVTLDSSVVNADGNIDAFIPTGSDSANCLVTLGDGNIYGSGPSPAICVPRTFQDQKGIRIIVIPYFSAFPTDLTLSVTVYQLGAHGYGQAELYTGP